MSDSFFLKGTMRCPIHKRVELGDRTNVVTSDYYTIPANLKIVCKSDGPKRRCVASYDDCPSGVFEGDPTPAKPNRYHIRGLRPPDRVSRGKDMSGGWNTFVRWPGEEGWDRNTRAEEEFSIQVWDDDKPSGRRPEVFPSGSAFERPYPRSKDLHLERHGRSIQTSMAELKQLAEVIRQSAAKEVTRHGGLAYDELRKSPPIRIGGEEIDWER